MKVIHLSQTDNSGGASRAALRLHLALREHGIDSSMTVGVNFTDIAAIRGPKSRFGWVFNYVRPAAGMALMQLQKTANRNLHTPAFLLSNYADAINASSADVVHIHGIGAEFMSVADVGRIRKPVVWTLHDMWGFCGAEHVTDDGPNARWRTGYRRDNRPAGHSGLDVDRWTWKRKIKAWRRPMSIITPSNWLGECARASKLMASWPLHVVPNTLDLKQFQPWPKQLARKVLGLPEGSVPLLIFGAIGATQDANKGWDLLLQALPQIAASHPALHLVVLGQSQPDPPPRIGLPIHWLGRLHDNASIALAYSAADLAVVPSRRENLPQSATEAQACGCPVVAFRTSGLIDAVQHESSGYLAEPYDTSDLAQGIAGFLDRPDILEKAGRAARERAVRLWAPEVVVPGIVGIYEDAIASRR